MIVLAWCALMLFALAALGAIADRWPVDEQRSVDAHERFLRALRGRRP